MPLLPRRQPPVYHPQRVKYRILDDMQTPYVKLARSIALEAGKIIRTHFDTNVAKRTKNDLTPVTIADEQINAMVIRRIGEVYPDHAVIGEEGTNGKTSRLAWVCDPLDGTIPYTKTIPVSVFSLALVDEGKPILGVVYDPFTNRLYMAEKGKGAYVNDKPIHVNAQKSEKGSMMLIEWWSDSLYDVDTAMHHMSKDTKVYVLHLGSIVQSGCLVASGQVIATIFPGTKGKFIDMAAIKIIVEEAGGSVTDLYGNDQRYDRDIKGAVVSNGIVHKEVLAYLKKYM